jgi:hypothetical protein
VNINNDNIIFETLSHNKINVNSSNVDQEFCTINNSKQVSKSSNNIQVSHEIKNNLNIFKQDFFK